jgi:phosphoglycolate phosphatase
MGDSPGEGQEHGMRVAVFDLDGTLADTSADLIAAANATFAEAGLGRPLDAWGDRTVAFAGGRAMLRAGFERAGGAWDEGDVAGLYPRLIELYGAALAVETRLYDGAEAALARLAAAGWALGICTNKPERLALRLLERLGIARRFAAVVGADTLPVRKPDPRHLLETIARAGGVPGLAVHVGDTATDREVARAAGVACVLVGFGPDGAAVQRLAPDALLDHFSQLPAVLERLVPVGAVPA